MSKIEVIVVVKKAENGRAELAVQCVSDVRGFKNTDAFYSLRDGDTLTVQIPVEPELARGPEYIVGQWMVA